MNLKNIYFSWLIYWGKMKGLLNGIAEAIILLASLASFFVLIYQFGFVQTPDSVHILERSRPFILLAFFTGITLRYVVRFQEIIQEKMLYLDISIYFLLFAVLSSKIFFKDAIALYDHFGLEHIDYALGCTGHVDCDVRMLRELYKNAR